MSSFVTPRPNRGRKQHWAKNGHLLHMLLHAGATVYEHAAWQQVFPFVALRLRDPDVTLRLPALCGRRVTLLRFLSPQIRLRQRVRLHTAGRDQQSGATAARRLHDDPRDGAHCCSHRGGRFTQMNVHTQKVCSHGQMFALRRYILTPWWSLLFTQRR